MEVREHFYSDDPALGPADGKTTLPGADYFFLGNGLIQAAVQVAPSGGATPVGLLIVDPERLGPKRAALTFDPETGLAATALSLVECGAVRSARGGPEMAPTRISKFNTAAQIIFMISALTALAGADLPQWWLKISLSIMVPTTLWSGIDYVWRWSSRAIKEHKGGV